MNDQIVTKVDVVENGKIAESVTVTTGGANIVGDGRENADGSVSSNEAKAEAQA